MSTRPSARFRAALLKIVADIAKEHAQTLVLNKSHVIVTAESDDFTDETMKRLDAKLPSVKLTGAN